MVIASELISPKVGIIGGTGRMGSWFGDLLEGIGSRVFRIGRMTDMTPAQAARKCEVVVISVPMAHTVAMIEEIGPLVSENGLLMDLTSVKKGPMEAMVRCSRAEVVGAHPLFGPSAADGSVRRVALCPGRGERGLSWLKGVLEDAGLIVTVIAPEEHDRMMGIIQGVNHLSTLAMALCISRSGFSFEDLLSCSTQTFMQRLDRIRSILEQPAELFGSILMHNPPARGFIDQYVTAAEELARVATKTDGEAFGDIFEMLREFFKR